MPVILRGVKLQGLAAQLARLPVLIKGMLQQILLGDRGVNLVQKFRVPHGGPSDDVLSAKAIGTLV
jgi:hypothetical protein